MGERVSLRVCSRVLEIRCIADQCARRVCKILVFSNSTRELK